MPVRAVGTERTVSTQQNPEKAGLLRCGICEHYIEPRRSFTCRKCRKSPLCLEHLDHEYKICSGCASEKRLNLYHDLLQQERNLRGFMRLAQFLFIVAAIFFVALRVFPDLLPDYLRELVSFEYLYIWGALSITGMVLCLILLSAQRRKLKELDAEIRGKRIFSRIPSA